MTYPPPFRGLVFDMDGTLTATEPLHMQAWLDVLARYGLIFGSSWFRQWVGLSDRMLAESVLREYDLQVELEVLQEEKRQLFYQTARERAELYPGTEDGLVHLGSRYPLALATSSSDRDAEAVFSRTQLNRFFGVIVTADRVEKLKPDPSCYLLACRELGLSPTDCLAVEDSPAGVRAAKRAGLTVVAVTTSQTTDRLAEADHLFPDTRSAMDWLLRT